MENFEYLAKAGILFNVDSFSQLEKLKEFAPMNISIRFNPAIGGVGFNKKFEMSGKSIKGSRLGIFKDRIIEAFYKAKEYGLNPIALHQHVGSNWLHGEQFNPYFEAINEAISVVKELENNGFKIEMLDVGGGMGVRSNEIYPEFPLESFMEKLWKVISNADINIKKLAIEPGRYIVGNSGVLIATVNTVEKKNNVNFIGINAGFNMFHHKFLYNIESEIVNLSKIKKTNEISYAVTGYLGEQGDVFTENKEMPLTVEGDIIMIFPAGAYCSSELAIHHYLPVPSELFLNIKEKKPYILSNYCKICDKPCCKFANVNLQLHEYELIHSDIVDENLFLYDENLIRINVNKKKKCGFLVNGICSINNIKPLECKLYPLFPSVKKNEILVHRDCPASYFLNQEFIDYATNEIYKMSGELRNSYCRLSNKENAKLEVFNE